MKIAFIMVTLPSDMDRRELKAYAFLLPSILLAAVFAFYPLARSIIGSFLTVSQSGRILGIAGLGNYISLLHDPAFISSIGNTVAFTIPFLLLNTSITLLAAALTRKETRGTSIAESIFIAPLAFSLSALALIFRGIFRGSVSIASRITGLDIAWLEEPVSAMAVLVLMGVFLDFALDYILLLSSFRSIDRSILEAAEIDGASGSRIFLSIELPAAASMLHTTIFIALKDAVLISAPVMVLTGGGPFRSTETVMYYYYLEAFRSGNRAVGTTIATLMVLSSAVIMSLVMRRRRNG